MKLKLTAPSDGGFDERVELLVPSDGKLQMAGRDALHLQVLGGVTCQLQHLRNTVQDYSEAPVQSASGSLLHHKTKHLHPYASPKL